MQFVQTKITVFFSEKKQDFLKIVLITLYFVDS